MEIKPAVFIGGSKKAIKGFPTAARKEAGIQILSIQSGDDPTDWKPMKGIGPGVREIRIHEPHEHRVIYVANFSDAIYVLHAFEKKTQQTPQRHIETARAAYAEIKRIRQEKK